MVSGLSGIIAIAAGNGSSFALTTNGNVYAWGNNTGHQLALGSAAITPTIVPGLSNICLINQAQNVGQAVDNAGILWDFGNGVWDGSGNWGGNTYNTIYPPKKNTSYSIEFQGSFGPKALVNYQSYQAAIDTSGNLHQWGIMDFNNWPIMFVAPVVTNIDWGYNHSYAESAVEPGAYYRGNSNEADFASFVIPLNLQTGVLLTNIGGNATNLLPFVTDYETNYQYDAANSGTNGQSDLSLRIPYQSPIVAFGSRVGGTPLYAGQSCQFAIFGGCPAMINDYPMLTNYESALQIEIYSKSDYSLLATTNFAIPFYLTTNGDWTAFLTNGLTTTLNAYGLATTLSPLSYPNAYGVTNKGALQLSHMASDAATNYIYVIKFKGMNGNGWMSLDQNGNPAWTPLYTLEFRPAPPWNIRFLSQVQFQGVPMPPFYTGKSLDELLTGSWVVTNAINVANPTSYTNVNDSPELRDSTILDNFVVQLKNDPLAIARFVQNEIELTDGIDYLGNSQITVGQLTLGGVNRGALGTFLERQGSPVEQCELLVYLLRKAGVPALYAFPPTDGIRMQDSSLSSMLRVQLNGAINPSTGAVNTNQFVAVNYPWVVAYVNNKWIHLFPWIKDTEIIQGPNIYDYMPASYNNATKWVTGYLYNKPEIVGLGDTKRSP